MNEFDKYLKWFRDLNKETLSGRILSSANGKAAAAE
jgi:hypothetical protein